MKLLLGRKLGQVTHVGNLKVTVIKMGYRFAHISVVGNYKSFKREILIDEEVKIDDEVFITAVSITRTNVKIMFNAPKHIKILRDEILTK